MFKELKEKATKVVKNIVDKASRWTLDKILEAANLRDLLGLAYLKSRRQTCPFTTLLILLTIGVYKCEDWLARTIGWKSSRT